MKKVYYTGSNFFNKADWDTLGHHPPQIRKFGIYSRTNSTLILHFFLIEHGVFCSEFQCLLCNCHHKTNSSLQQVLQQYISSETTEVRSTVPGIRIQCLSAMVSRILLILNQFLLKVSKMLFQRPNNYNIYKIRLSQKISISYKFIISRRTTLYLVFRNFPVSPPCCRSLKSQNPNAPQSCQKHIVPNTIP